MNVSSGHTSAFNGQRSDASNSREVEVKFGLTNSLYRMSVDISLRLECIRLTN